MGVKLFVLFLTMLAVDTTVAQCQGRMVNPNMVGSILQDILSPANTQRAMQLIKMAATGTNRQMPVPEVTMPAKFITKPVEKAVPLQIMPSERRPRAYVANTIEPPRIMANLEIMQVRNDRIPSRVMPSMANPVAKVMMQQFVKQPMVEPYPIMSQGMVNYASMSSPQFCGARTPSLMSPYLPAASPVSAFASPTSNMLPPPTQARNQFLRKIPIPPPTL